MKIISLEFEDSLEEFQDALRVCYSRGLACLVTRSCLHVLAALPATNIGNDRSRSSRKEGETLQGAQGISTTPTC